MTKADLRSHYRTIRNRHAEGLSPEDRQREAQAIRMQVEKTMKVPRRIAGYAAMPSELDIGPALEAWREAGDTIALPWFADRDSPMRFRADDGCRAPGPFGIDQPLPGNPDIVPQLVLVPLVAADRAGNRIGQGAGHYDRALARLRNTEELTAIGVCWDCQIAEALPADPWDEPHDLIATPTQAIAPR
ncbi:MAG: 5-formyltetrahydrofolate cyclo-ligase [Parasphingopyxis sp.]